MSIRRDWGWVQDHVEAVWGMIQCSTPDDFVIASDVSHNLEEFVAAAFAEVGLDWRAHVDYDPSLKRPSDISFSIEDPTKAEQVLGWRAKMRFPEIVARMVQSEWKGPAPVSEPVAESIFRVPGNAG
jgi:GDPmannose 4,6-dehydratase